MPQEDSPVPPATANANAVESKSPLATPADQGRAVATAAAPVLTPDAITPPRRSKARYILPLVAIALLGYGANAGWNWYAEGRFIVSTDDAYVRADTAAIAAKVSGYVTSVGVRDNALAARGDLLVSIDKGDYALAVEAANRKLDTQDSSIARIVEQEKAQRAVIEQAKAQVAAARADQQRAFSEYERAKLLVLNAAGTQQRIDTTLADRDRTVAAEQGAEAALQAAKANLAVLEAQKGEAEHARAELVTARDRAVRDLSFTEIRAPFDGVVGNRSVQTGQFVQPGARLLALVPLASTFVEANFKETQLARLKPGQKVAIHVDALPGRAIEGIVDSFSPASGAQFSLLPPENATGNFTKIVQRVPVRIRIPAELAAEGVLRPGLSVVADVDTRAPDTPKQTLLGSLGFQH